MRIEGKVLNVGDGDAIIIKASKAGKEILIVVDGGDTSYAAKSLSQVKQYCSDMGKEAPDLLVCTHYDSDHIAGIITLVEHYKEKIKNIWIHQPVGVLKESLKAAPAVLDHIHGKNVTFDFNQFVLHQSYLSVTQFDKYKLVIEGVGQLQTLLGLIKKYKINTQQPIVGECSLPGWEEIKVIGPTREYFDEVFKKQNSLLQIFQEEYEEMILEDARVKNVMPVNPCDLLKSTSRITPTNKASAVIRFDCENGKYLFTADAGIESLKATIEYPTSIRNLHFLKIPHHGSNNNISTELVNLMDPEIAYSSGNRHEDVEVIMCFRRKIERVVKTTKESDDLLF